MKGINRDDETGDELRIGFWNIRGLTTKDEEFWSYIMNFDVIGLTETWMTEEQWKQWEYDLPKQFRWKRVNATKKHKKGRAAGGILTGVKVEIEEKEQETIQSEMMQERRIMVGEKEWRIITVYSNQKMEQVKGILEGRIEEREEKYLLIGGDFNARIGERGNTERVRAGIIEERKSKDKTVNQEGEKLISLTEERGWIIMNGMMLGDVEGEWTYHGPRGESVVDYVVVNEEASEGIIKFQVEERVESDHQPILVEIRKKEEVKRRDEMEKQVERVEDWTENGVKEYQEKMVKVIFKEKNNVNDMLEEIIREVKLCTKIKTRKKRKVGYKIWWDEECKRKKRKVTTAFSRWRRGVGRKEKWAAERKEYKELRERKKEEVRIKEREEIAGIRSEQEVWKYVNKERRVKKEISREIEEKEWKEHFKRVLDGTEEKIEIERLQEQRERNNESIIEITREELNAAIRKLKKKKASGEDGVKNEAWIYATENLKEHILTVFNRIWIKREYPKRWRIGIIKPIPKGGVPNIVENYRGLSLMNTLYKLYATILLGKLEGEMEEKGLIPDIQAGFRKGRSTVDNVYILNYIVQREIAEERGKLYTLFADMKAAYDMVDRWELIRMLESKGIEQQLIDAIEDIYRETESLLNVNGRNIANLWTNRGLRQGCPISPALFSLYISDIEEYMMRGQLGGIVVGKKKFMVLAYADDLVVIAKTEAEMKAMLRRFRQYVDRKRLKLNVKKSKIMVFKKGGKEKKYKWEWGGEMVETVREWKYLGMHMKSNNSKEGHMIQVVKKAMGAMTQLWSLGERKFKGDYKTRIMLFDSIVRGIVLYGAEIWGWERQPKLEKLQIKYIKWVLGLDRNTPTYIALEETKRNELWIEAGKRAMRYEEKNRGRLDKEILGECMREVSIRERQGKRKGKWEIKRKEFYERGGWSVIEIEQKREAGQTMEERIVRRLMEVQGQEQINEIRKSRYNRKYEIVRVPWLPYYLAKRWKGNEQKVIARFRCGNYEKGNQFWKKEEERMCERCCREVETIEHLISGCGNERRSSWSRESLLNDTGHGLREMMNILERKGLKRV